MAAALLFKTPLCYFIMLGLDRLKRGRRVPVAGVVLALLASMLYSKAEINGRPGDPESGGGAAISPTDQVLFLLQLFESSLMGRYTPPWMKEIRRRRMALWLSR